MVQEKKGREGMYMPFAYFDRDTFKLCIYGLRLVGLCEAHFLGESAACLLLLQFRTTFMFGSTLNALIFLDEISGIDMAVSWLKRDGFEF